MFLERKNMLKVNEIFGPTIQGEGPSQGKKVWFLRLSYCNLQCVWCDSKYTWDWKQYDRTKEVHEMDNDVILERLKEANAVVISGGEPLLQQRNLLTLIGGLVKRNCWVEVETNGTILPDEVFLSLINQINCSPKLSNSGDSRKKRIKSDVLKVLASIDKVYFKFVVSCEQDIDEVWEYVNTYKIPRRRVYLMPLGKTPEELKLTTKIVRELSFQNGFVFSSRLHIELWGQKRGV